jgi:hypothetical protein
MRRTVAAPASCSAILTANPGLASGWQLVDPDGAAGKPAFGVYCDMVTPGGPYSYYPINNGINTTRFDQANSCDALGLHMVIPRTQAHLNAMYALYGAGYFATIPGVYGLAAGNYTGCAMNSTDATCAANWKAIDGNAWFVRGVAFGEPNGDYVPGCWLGAGGVDANGWTFNDGNCGYATGTSYVCSDNAK